MTDADSHEALVPDSYMARHLEELALVVRRLPEAQFSICIHPGRRDQCGHSTCRSAMATVRHRAKEAASL